jgi:hypothetical protein
MKNVFLLVVVLIGFCFDQDSHANQNTSPVAATEPLSETVASSSATASELILEVSIILEKIEKYSAAVDEISNRAKAKGLDGSSKGIMPALNQAEMTALKLIEEFTLEIEKGNLSLPHARQKVDALTMSVGDILLAIEIFDQEI